MGINTPSFSWIGVLIAAFALVLITLGVLVGGSEIGRPTEGQVIPNITATSAALEVRERAGKLSATETVIARELEIGAAQQEAALTAIVAAPSQTAQAEKYRADRDNTIARETGVAFQNAMLPLLLIAGFITVVALLMLFGLRYQAVRVREEEARLAAAKAETEAAQKRHEVLEKQIQLEREKRHTLYVSDTILNKHTKERAAWN